MGTKALAKEKGYQALQAGLSKRSDLWSFKAPTLSPHIRALDRPKVADIAYLAAATANAPAPVAQSPASPPPPPAAPGPLVPKSKRHWALAMVEGAADCGWPRFR